MGVPVVTLRGDRHLSRVGASLLSAVGYPGWIASSEDEYVRIAVDLAADPVRLAGCRTGLRARIVASPLGDHVGQAERFAAALRNCWRDWVVKLPVPDRSGPAALPLVAA